MLSMLASAPSRRFKPPSLMNANKGSLWSHLARTWGQIDRRAGWGDQVSLWQGATKPKIAANQPQPVISFRTART